LAIAFLIASAGSTVTAQAPDGAQIFQRRCAACHSGAADARGPSPEALRLRAPDAIVESLVNGAMRVQGAQMSGPERRAVAEHLTGKAIGGDVTGSAAGR
jgi:mono/diheme cytochrome c family protein